MDISKLILIDIALAISAIPLLFWLKGRHNKSSLFQSSNKEELLKKTCIALPDKENLIDLEKLAMREGSSIDFDSLVGDWKFISVWNKDSNDEDSIFSSLLRVFSANLELKKDISPQKPLVFNVSASIQFGFFSIKFSGSGFLKGKQPILHFFFNLIEFKSGPRVLFRRSINEPIEQEKSFFALIASEVNGKWLAARGQGGALVLWLKD